VIVLRLLLEDQDFFLLSQSQIDESNEENTFVLLHRFGQKQFDTLYDIDEYILYQVRELATPGNWLLAITEALKNIWLIWVVLWVYND